ncbi:MAG TPA: hypothetical protein VMV18_09175 [bacterium]|nr:hypothetical protein [bacterium]
MAETVARESSAPSGTTQTGVVDDKAVKSIATNDYFRFLGEEKVRKVAEAIEKMGATELFNNGRWINPSIRHEILKILGPELPQISETYAYLVVRRYKDLKRFYREQAELAEKKRIEDEAKAKAAAEKAAKAAAAKAAAAAAPKPAEAKPADAKPSEPEKK